MWTLFRWQNIIDYCTVTIFLYVLLHLAREARALRTAVFIVALYAGALVARNFDLLITQPGCWRRAHSSESRCWCSRFNPSCVMFCSN